jgi:tRNA modification GTPase
MHVTTSCSRGAAGVQPIRVAILTPPGRGAIAVVGAWGPGAVEFVGRLFVPRGPTSLAARADGGIAFGTWRASGEDVVVVRHGRERLEIHGHGGTAAPAAVLASLLAAGASPGRWQDWCGHGPCATEAVEYLPAATGPKAARILSRQAAGSLDRAFEQLTAALSSGDLKRARAMADRLRAASRVGMRLIEPWRIVIAGEVNAGKSSLVNAILGHGRSIVSPLPGTTRDVLVVPAVLDGWAVELVDTAGTRGGHAVDSPTEREGIARAAAAARRADLVVRVLPPDATSAAATRPGVPELVVRSKADLAATVHPAGEIVTSAATGLGIEPLTAAIVSRLVPEEVGDPALLAGPVPFTARQIELLEHLVAAAAHSSASSGPPAGVSSDFSPDVAPDLSPVPRPRT